MAVWQIASSRHSLLCDNAPHARHLPSPLSLTHLYSPHISARANSTSTSPPGDHIFIISNPSTNLHDAFEPLPVDHHTTWLPVPLP